MPHFKNRFADFIKRDDFPCVGAKSALAQSNIVFFEGERIDRSTDDLPLYRALRSFGTLLDKDPTKLRSFAAGYKGPCDLSESTFEIALWDRLQSLHNFDALTGIEWPDHVSPDPSSPHFSMSVGGTPYFVVGLHPNASRQARRFEQPILVFNPHDQFEALRGDGRFSKMQSKIRGRDIALAGSINPMLANHGAASEAKQYSGRRVPDDWDCPITIWNSE